MFSQALACNTVLNGTTYMCTGEPCSFDTQCQSSCCFSNRCTEDVCFQRQLNQATYLIAASGGVLALLYACFYICYLRKRNKRLNDQIKSMEGSLSTQERVA